MGPRPRMRDHARPCEPVGQPAENGEDPRALQGSSGSCRLSPRAADEARTRDPQLGKLMLYQLSYRRLRRAIIAADYPCGREALRRSHRRRRAGGRPRRAARLRRGGAARRHVAGLRGAKGQRPAAPGAGVTLPVLDGKARRLAGAAARQGRGAELLGLVVRAVRERGAGARARAAQAGRQRRHGAGRDLQGRRRRVARLRARSTSSPTRACATTGSTSRRSTGRRSCPRPSSSTRPATSWRCRAARSRRTSSRGPSTGRRRS